VKLYCLEFNYSHWWNCAEGTRLGRIKTTH